MDHSSLRHQKSFFLCFEDFFTWFLPEFQSVLKFETAHFLDEDEIGYSPGENIQDDGNALVSVEMKIGIEWVKSFVYWLHLTRRPPDFERLLSHAYYKLYSQYEAFILPIVMYSGPVPLVEPDAAPSEKIVEQYRAFRFQQIELKRYTALEIMDTAGRNPLLWAYLPFTEYEPWQRPEILAISLQGISDSVDGDDGEKVSTLASLVIHSMSLNEEEEDLLAILLHERTKFEEAKMLYSLREEGIEVGLARGFKKGLGRGLKKGLKRGRKSTAILHARKLLSKNIKWEVITEVTGITEEILANEPPFE